MWASGSQERVNACKTSRQVFLLAVELSSSRMGPQLGFDRTDFGFWQAKAVSLIVAGYKVVSSPAVPTTKLQ